MNEFLASGDKQNKTKQKRIRVYFRAVLNSSIFLLETCKNYSFGPLIILRLSDSLEDTTKKHNQESQ